MSDSFAPNESISRFETNSGLLLYWPYLLLGGAAVVWAASNVPDMVSGNDAPFPRNRFIFACCVGMILFGVAARLNRRRVKWVQTADAGGIQWCAGGRVWHRTWDQLVGIDFESYYYVQPDGTQGLGHQVMTVKFDDGAELCIQSWLWNKYLFLRHILQAKEDHAAATAWATRHAGARPTATRAEAERAAADQATRFGPLTIHRGGLEWDGLYYSWEQIEGYEIQQGFLIIRTVGGDEFLRRTADLGDWRTAIERLEAAAGRMAGRRATSDR